MMASRPNILFLHCHDLGRFTRAYGIPTVRTPNLDALASDGVRFKDAFATAPQCSPSRASLFTGRYPQENGVLGLTHAEYGWDLDPREHHLAGALQGYGYHTALIGVHHESRVRSDAEVAARLGFDSVNSEQVSADQIAERTVETIRQFARAQQPFYLQVGFHEPHRISSGRDEPGVVGFVEDGVEPDAEFGTTIPPYLLDSIDARIEMAELQGAVRYLDVAVGRILAALKEYDLGESTIVVFTTDHGLALPRAKCTLYDPGLEVALIMKVPQRPQWARRAVGGLVSNIDVFPTLMELVDLEPPARVAGRSMVPLVEVSHQARAEVFAQITYHAYYDPRRCVRTGHNKLIARFASAPDIMDASESWRPRCTPRNLASSTSGIHPYLELYDLRSDPHEFSNIINDASASLREALLSKLVSWMKDVGDPVLRGAVMCPLGRRIREEMLTSGR